MKIKNTIQAVIVAAGRGSRMNELTEEKPKCLLELAGKPLLEWQLESLNKAGLSDILVVRGYRADLLPGKQGKFSYEYTENPLWAETNMVKSLLCALPKIEKKTIIVSYSDIVYSPEHVKNLMQAEGDISITYDTLWQELWQLRAENTTDDILDDAENFFEENGKLLRIGSKAKKLDEVHGQYMGLLKFTPKGLGVVKKYLATLSEEKQAKLDMTSLLAALLESGEHISAVAVDGAWCECDTEADIHKYEQVLALHKKNKWKHDWR